MLKKYTSNQKYFHTSLWVFLYLFYYALCDWTVFIIFINPARYQVMKHKDGSLKDGVITDNPVISYNFPILVVDDRPCLYLYDSDVDFVIKEWEESIGSIEVADTEIVS